MLNKNPPANLPWGSSDQVPTQSHGPCYSYSMTSKLAPTADIGVMGLAVMGQNLILNMNDHGFVVAAFNRTVSKVDDFLAREAKGTHVIGARSLQEMTALLKRPRRVM